MLARILETISGDWMEGEKKSLKRLSAYVR